MEHRILAPALAACLAALVLIDMKGENELASEQVVLRMPTDHAYRVVSNFLGYNQWQPSITHTESADLPSENFIGASFTTYMSVTLIGQIGFVQTVTAVEVGKQFIHDSNSWLQTRYEYTVRAGTKPGTTVIAMRVTSSRQSAFAQYILGPIVGFYYQNWVTQGLINLKMEQQTGGKS